MYKRVLATALLILALGASDALAQQQRPLIELAAPNGDGWLYTISEQEAAAAAGAPYFFKRQPQAAAIIWGEGFDASRPLYRCRFKPRPSYLVTALPGECDDKQFVFEGVLGSIATQPAPGLEPLHRLTKRGEWRVAFEPRRAELVQQGYHDDGRLGYAIVPGTGAPVPPPTPAPPAPSPPPAPPVADPCDTAPRAPGVSLRIAAGRSASFSRSRTVRRRSRAGIRVRGRLRGADGRALKNAVVCVVSRRAKSRATPRRIGMVTTNRRGQFRYRVRRGSSRRITFVHRTVDGAASATLRLKVRARASR